VFCGGANETQGLQNLTVRIQRMSKLSNLFVTVTWGAGGSSAKKSLDLAEICQKDLGIPTCLHLTCTNMDKTILDEALERAKSIGIRNILALRGDPPRGEEYWDADRNNEFKYAIDLVKYIRCTYGDYFCIGVAAYPEGHVDGVDESGQDPAKDIPFLAEKVKAGASFIVTQLFYDCDKFLTFEKCLRNHESGAFKDIVVIPGLMPINTYQSFLRAAKLSHASIPASILENIRNIPLGDDDQVKQFGVDLISDIIQIIVTKTNGRIRGFHFYTLNLEKSVARILEKSGLLDTGDDDVAVEGEIELQVPSDLVKRRASSLLAHNRLIVDKDDEASKAQFPDDEVSELEAGVKVATPAGSDALAISSGEGDLGREATWDDFPNGRFGDSRSPAFGEIDGYGPTLHVAAAKAYKLWGYPVDFKDVILLFARHIRNELEVLPFSDQSLSPETSLIQEELLAMIHKGLLTVASQPAGDSIKSTDKIFGWGPPGGRVFQKAFVEFFVSDEMWHNLKTELDSLGDLVSYYDGTSGKDNNFSTNLRAGSSNAVTWGVFPNREVVQSTILEEESFLAFRDEAFSIWKEWCQLYKPGTASYELLDNIHKTYHLVSVVHHDYFSESGLWEIFDRL
jgi:methylenetetrahydrofolate reductase (NADPH)